MNEFRASAFTAWLLAMVAGVSLVGGCAKSEPEATKTETANTANATNQPPVEAVVSEDENASKERQPGNVVQREGEPDIILVDENDPEMEAAMKTAQRTVPDFLRVLQSPTPNQSGFAVKVGVRDDEHFEAMWIRSVEYDGKKFSGILNNEPNSVTTVKFGDRLETSPNELLDWLYIEDGKLVGGYTVRLLVDRMSEEQRKLFDENAAFTIE